MWQTTMQAKQYWEWKTQQIPTYFSSTHISHSICRRFDKVVWTLFRLMYKKDIFIIERTTFGTSKQAQKSDKTTTFNFLHGKNREIENNNDTKISLLKGRPDPHNYIYDNPIR